MFQSIVCVSVTPALCLVAGVTAQAQTTFPNILAALNSTGNFTVLLSAISAANLTSLLQTPSLNLTLFAPTDAGFTTMLRTLNLTANDVLSQPALVQQVLNLHVLNGPVLSSAVPTQPTLVPTLA